MTEDSGDFEIRFDADVRPFADAIAGLERLSEGFGRRLSSAMKDAVVSGRSLEDVLRRISLDLAGMVLGQGIKPLAGLASGALSGLLGGLGGIVPFAKGGSTAGPVPFASGGVVASPTYFSMGRNVGLMGEAGAEAILPLRRAADGRLGVASAGGGGPQVNVVFNVTAQDASSFRKSEAQLTGMLARAVSRGSRSM